MRSISVGAVWSCKDSLQVFTKPVLKNMPLHFTYSYFAVGTNVLSQQFVLYNCTATTIRQGLRFVPNLTRMNQPIRGLVWHHMTSLGLWLVFANSDTESQNQTSGHSGALSSATVSGRTKNIKQNRNNKHDDYYFIYYMRCWIYIFSWPRRGKLCGFQSDSHTHTLTYGAEILNYKAMTLKLET